MSSDSAVNRMQFRSSSANRLNVGCGWNFSPNWVNVDLHRYDPSVLCIDISRGLPFSNGRFDVVYSSHVLEHLTPLAARDLVLECLRVLAPGGIIRIVVPDLQSIVAFYLSGLERVQRSPDSSAAKALYQWGVIELLDQMTRAESGGEMARYLSKLANLPVSARSVIVKRMGRLAKGVSKRDSDKAGVGVARRSVLRRVIQMNVREQIKKSVLGATDYAALQSGRFLRAGEVHRWMYDEYSLGDLLKSAGFIDIRRKTAMESSIFDWASENLDVDEHGEVIKPNSLFMEARRPARQSNGEK